MIANVLYKFYGYSSQGKSNSIFTDASQIAMWAKDSIDMMTLHSIIKGYPDGSFKPKGKLTRAESAELIYRMLSLDPKANI
ncbi:Cellulosome-anchoring protein precursor [compost metagenome]